MKNGFLVNKKRNEGINRSNFKAREDPNVNNRINKHKSHDAYVSINYKRSSYSTKQRNTMNNKNQEGVKKFKAFPENKLNQIYKSPIASIDISKTEDILFKHKTPQSHNQQMIRPKSNNSKNPRNTLDQIMSDGSYQEISSEESDKLSIGSEENNIKEKETNIDLYLSSINESSKPNVTGVINSFPKLSVNPFTNETQEDNTQLTDNNPQVQNQRQHQSNDDTLEMKYRKLLSLAKKGDRESFIDLLEKILQNNGNIDYQDESGWAALHYACDEGNLKIVEILLKANSDVNSKSQNKRTPLHITASHGYFDLSKLLVENGAIINTNDNEKNTPLHLCAMSGHVELLKYFLDKYPQANSKNIYGKTPIALASKPEIKELLKEYMAKKGSVYHKIKIHKTNDTVMNSMLNKKPLKIVTEGNDNETKHKTPTYSNSSQNVEKIASTPQQMSTNNYNSNQNKFALLNSSNHLSINIQTNINNTNIKNSNKKLQMTVNTNINDNNVIESYQSTPSNRIMIPKTVKHQISPTNSLPKKNSISNFSINNPMNKKRSTVSSAIKLPKTKTLTKFNQIKSKENGMLKEEIGDNANLTQLIEQNSNNSNPNNNLSNYHSDNYRLNRTEEMGYNKQNQIDLTNEDNLYSQINLNSIEEERITPNSFVCLALIGRGSFGEVYLVEKINSKFKYAMKVLDKDRVMGQNLLKYAIAERNVLSLTNHPFIVKLNFAFQTTNQLFLILDYCPGGDLSKHLYYEKRFTEERAKYYICEILLALEDLHKRDIIFRDLKPDNVVLDQEGHAKLTDFGLSKEGVCNSICARSFCGSIAYLAPEMLRKQGHGKAVDWYLLGVLFYEMLVGIPPFFTEQK